MALSNPQVIHIKKQDAKFEPCDSYKLYSYKKYLNNNTYTLSKFSSHTVFVPIFKK